MKKIVLLIFAFLANYSWSQQDSLYFDNEIEMADKMFELLDENIYGKSLLNKAINSSKIVEEQIGGDYSQVFGIEEWSDVFNTVSLSYRDHSKVPDIYTFGSNVFDYFGYLDFTYNDLVQPFGLVLNSSSYIDTSKLNPEHFENLNGSINPIVNEEELYTEVLLKSATLLEFYPVNGYYTGSIIYNEDFIITSEDIEIESIYLNLNDGKGFQEFGENSPILSYDRKKDSTVAQAKITYLKNGETYVDRLDFYLTTESHLDDIKANDPEPWDTTFEFDEIAGDGLKFEVGVKFGCGNDGKIRRPIVVAPPYRPVVQQFSMEEYWNQFNIGGLLESYVGLGYDLIWVKEKPGNKSLQTCGDEFAELILYVNSIKRSNFPDEDWETIVMGYSKGGQDARYALKKLEKQHMDGFGEHPHTRLYLTFDSPHHGASIPLYSQSVYREFFLTNFLATIAYLSLIDEASTDMGGYTITASTPPVFLATPFGAASMTPHPHQNAIDYQNEISNSFNHTYTHTNDTRRSFPSFTRNVAVSTGSYKDNYYQYFDWNFTPGLLIFKQNAPTYNILLGGFGMANRRLWGSKYSTTQGQKVFRRFDVYTILGVPQFFIFKSYKFKNAYEWDMAQGGYKDNFLDKVGGPIPILRSSTFGLGTQKYKKSVMFMPLVSALAINPTTWQNNNLYYNLQDEHLFYIAGDPINGFTPTDLFGYPHLGHPNDHFDITPFEAVYADQYIWDHIVFSNTLEDYAVHGVGQADLDSCRDFLNDEVEGWHNWLQNKVVGQNHVVDPNYEYKAWYKARGVFRIGENITPKTDVGPYIIQSTGNITVYANDAIEIQPGFHAQAGSRFHAFIQYDDCALGPFEQNLNNGYAENVKKQRNLSLQVEEKLAPTTFSDYTNLIHLYPNPNTGQFIFVIKEQTNAFGQIFVYTLTGQQVYTHQVTENITHLNLNLEKGVYLVVYRTETVSKTLKMIIQ